MIRFEHNMLVLNNTFSKEDVEEINAFADYVRNQERERIIALLEAVDDELGIFGVGWIMQEIAELIRGESE